MVTFTDEQGERIADAAGFQNPADATRDIILSMLLGHEVDRCCDWLRSIDDDPERWTVRV